MLVYVLNKNNEPLMPCLPAKARLLLKEKKAKVKCKTPFTIKLLFGSSGYKQEVIVGMDTGSKTIGCAAIANDKVVYQAEIIIRDDVSIKIKQRKMYRNTRRNKKTRYRQPRWRNRANSKREGRLPPSIKSKIDSHIREKNFVENILPVKKWKIETASFDIHKITNPNVSGIDYQNGPQKDFYNTKAYVLHRDGYKCQAKETKHNKKLCVHHILPIFKGGTNTPSNLICLCIDCSKELLSSKLILSNKKRSITRDATQMGIIKSQLKKQKWIFEEVYGSDTKYYREQILNLPKSHMNDAIAIACNEKQYVIPSNNVYKKRHVCKGDYQQTKRLGKINIPTGKLFGLRKFDKIKTSKGIGFIKGKRTTGYFSIMDINNNIIHASINIKNNIIRISARRTTLII